MNTLDKEIKRLLSKLTVQNGKVIACSSDRDDTDFDLFRDFHGTDIMPDDFRWDHILRLLERLTEYEFDSVDYIRDHGIDYEIIDSLVDVYTGHLTAWLASHNSRVEWCNEAVTSQLVDGSDIIKTIQYGQYLEIQMIMNNILSYLETLGE